MFTSTQDRLKIRERERILAEKKDRAERLAALKELLPSAPFNFRKKISDRLQELFDKKAEYNGRAKTFNIMAIIIDNLHRYRKQKIPSKKDQEQQTEQPFQKHKDKMNFKQFCEMYILPPSKKDKKYQKCKKNIKKSKSATSKNGTSKPKCMKVDSKNIFNKNLSSKNLLNKTLSNKNSSKKILSKPKM